MQFAKLQIISVLRQFFSFFIFKVVKNAPTQHCTGNIGNGIVDVAASFYGQNRLQSFGNNCQSCCNNQYL